MVNSCPFSIVIPAAGSSQRLGQAKQLVEINGQTLLQQTVQIAATLPAKEIIVITGSSAKELPTALELNKGCAIPVRLVYNPDWSEGIGTSIALGSRSVHKNTPGLMVLLCDQWQIKAADLQLLLEIWLRDTGRLVATSSQSITGPPAIFPRTCFSALGQLQGDTGARKVLQSHAHLLQGVEIKNAAADLDTPADLALLQTCLKKD